MVLGPNLRGQGRRGCVRKICSADDSDFTAINTIHELSNGFEFRIIKGVRR